MKGRLLTVTDIAYLIKRNPHTVKAWVRWSEDTKDIPEELKLPKALREAKNKGRAWAKEDVVKFKQFSKLISGKFKGAMSEWNAKHCWGKRGKKILIKKQEKEKNERKKD